MVGRKRGWGLGTGGRGAGVDFSPHPPAFELGGLEGQDFAADQMEADREGLLRPVKIKCRDGFPHVASQLFPAIGLRENALRQALPREATVGFSSDFKYQLVHACSLFHLSVRNKRQRPKPSEIFNLQSQTLPPLPVTPPTFRKAPTEWLRFSAACSPQDV